MQPTSYVMKLTGLPYETLFQLPLELRPVLFSDDAGGGKIEIFYWDAARLNNVPQPSAADFQAALKAPEPTSVPQSVTRAQAKIALLRAGHLDMVKTAVGASPEAEIWFEDAQIWERQNPYVIDLGEKLFGGATEVDALFIAAGQIQA